ncbi:amidophosphoribosyltransferase [Methanomassiliicoccales archaeon LGM-RCC1]|nr:amidophosphoribosyltransferase [Methanomassiliicoccales archaeon LGM-RCC1]
MAVNHSCGVVAISADYDVASDIYTALMIIQHRGQESAGISVYNGAAIRTIKGQGLVNDAIPTSSLSKLPGKSGIGHVRYATLGANGYENAQPLNVATNFGEIAVAHNGELTNYNELKEKYMKEGWVFFTQSDSELILRLLGKYLVDYSPTDAVHKIMDELDGAYSVVFTINGKTYGFRDRYGFRPLILGKLDGGYILVSESSAIEALKGEVIRDVEPGEICEITSTSYKFTPAENPKHPKAHCMFEWVYFARPDSVIDGRTVYDVRREIGRVLARECPADVDFVMPIPDSGRAHAIGYAIEAGIPYEEGFMMNRAAGRTFILPEQKLRETAVSMKMIPIRSAVSGKKVLIIDDSIVRGTTLKILIGMLKDAGAKEVHVRIGCPPVIAPCFYGVDMKTRDQFIANKHSIEEIREIIGADSLGYISLEGLIEAIGFKGEDLCLACVNNKYPTRIEGEVYRFDQN